MYWILLFEFETRTWSKIDLELPRNGVYYHLDMDENAILNVVTYAKVDENTEETLELRTASIRIPLKKPDKLLNLCWLRTRDCGLLGKFTYLESLI
jgi:hypothetical protein